MKFKLFVYSLILFSLFLTGCTQKEEKTMIRQPQAEKFFDCSKLSATECNKSLNCRSSSGSSCPMCMDIIHYCKYDPKKKEIKDECLELGRIWDEEEENNCLCLEGEDLPKVRPRGEYGILGCLTDQQLCETTGGKHAVSEKFSSASCECPEGHKWNIRLGCTK